MDSDTGYMNADTPQSFQPGSKEPDMQQTPAAEAATTTASTSGSTSENPYTIPNSDDEQDVDAKDFDDTAVAQKGDVDSVLSALDSQPEQVGVPGDDGAHFRAAMSPSDEFSFNGTPEQQDDKTSVKASRESSRHDWPAPEAPLDLDAAIDNDDESNNSLSPAQSMASPPSSAGEAPIEGPEDEIVVSSKSNAANSNRAAKSGAVGVDIGSQKVAEDTDASLVQRPKRKRASLYEDLGEEKMEDSIMEDVTEDIPTPAQDASTQPKIARGASAAKGVVIGIWRESPARDADKHAVKGFIDSRDRLRTRIQPLNKAGQVVIDTYPLKPGPGASWVTFNNILFDNHLVNLDQLQIKEYVKVRSELLENGPEEDPKMNDRIAVQKAIKICQERGPPPEGAPQPLIAYGAKIPEHIRAPNRVEKRRRTLPPGMALGGQSGQPLQPAPPTPLPDIPGTRPTKVLLGFWKGSAEETEQDKHAVFGILGSNDMFRVKVGRETRDGRPMISNFPQGAGALWINADDWEREPHLKDLSRDEIKEYCRVRQSHIDAGEREADRRDNEVRAVAEARYRASRLPPKGSKANNAGAAAAHYTSANFSHDAPAHETRQARRTGPNNPNLPPASSSRQSSQAPGFRAANRPGAVEAQIERVNSLATKSVHRIEASQAKFDERHAHMAPPHAPNGADSFRENIGRLNDVWTSQESHRIRAGNEDAKIHMGIKYERKRNGPFQGKLVSHGALISIDGEDYVEYRVLTKPTFI